MFRLLRRMWVRRRTVPAEWREILGRRAAFYPHLPEPMREKLHRRMQVFLDEKIYEGCGGLELTSEMRVLIAAYACMLILEEASDYYPALKAILVYPDEYVAPVHYEDYGGIVTEGWEERSGESWNPGNIVLSWRDIEEDLGRPFEGRNLIYHEFAHQMDFRYGISAGISFEGEAESEDAWTQALAATYRRLIKKSKRGTEDVLDLYGATNPAECFAVATETFLENPRGLRESDPGLYEQLKSLYGLDPARFIPL